MKYNIPHGSQGYALVPLQETVPPALLAQGDTPESIHAYLRKQIPVFPEVETAYVVLLSTRRKILGHVQISQGTLDTLPVHPREVFKPAIVANASAIVFVHNHPSGDPSPSEADIKVTRDLHRAGQVLKIDLLDHIIIGHPANVPPFVSLREQGYFYS